MGMGPQTASLTALKKNTFISDVILDKSFYIKWFYLDTLVLLNLHSSDIRSTVTWNPSQWSTYSIACTNPVCILNDFFRGDSA